MNEICWRKHIVPGFFHPTRIRNSMDFRLVKLYKNRLVKVQVNPTIGEFMDPSSDYNMRVDGHIIDYWDVISVSFTRQAGVEITGISIIELPQLA